MIQFGTNRVDPHKIKQQFESLPMRFEYLKKAIGNSVAERIQQDVVRRIPSGTGWLAIYKNAIKVTYNEKDEWVVAGEKEVPISAVDANATLLIFSGDDKATAVLAKFNPWPIDMVPAIDAIYVSKILMRTASEGEVKVRRDKLKPQMDAINYSLKTAGFTVLPNGLPKFGSSTVADLAFLAQRLENGLGGYPRVPHWRPASDNISATISRTLKATSSKFESILRGNIGKTPPTSSSKLRSMLASAVRKAPAT